MLHRWRITHRSRRHIRHLAQIGFNPLQILEIAGREAQHATAELAATIHELSDAVPPVA